jgi:hypothetical protein
MTEYVFMIKEVYIIMGPIANGYEDKNVCHKRPRVNRASPVALRDFAPAGRGTVSVSCGWQWYFIKPA